MKIDKRKKYYMVFDTETTSFKETAGLSYPLIYDLAFAIVDKKGKIYEEDNFLIKRTFYSELFNNAFFGNKRPIYEKMVKNNEIKLTTFKKALYEINQVLAKYPNITIAAYNLQFDIRALKNTAKLEKVQWYDGETVESLFYTQDIKQQDIWSLTVETILSRQKGFERFVKKHNLYTPNGNPSSSAETAYQYITLNPDFIEDHTALSDVYIEIKILAKALRQNKKYKKGIRYNTYHLMKHFKKEKVA